MALTLIALATAMLSGMTGLGGGTILIAALYALGFVPTVAVPLHAGVQLVSNGTRTLAYLRHVDWGTIGVFMIGAAPTPFLVAPLVARADPDLLRLGMAVFIVFALWPGWLQRVRLQGTLGMMIAVGMAGGLGMVVGATGLLVAPFFLRPGWDKETVIATMAVCQTGLHLIKILAFSAHGYGLLTHWHLLVPMAAAVIVGTLIGRRLVGWFNEHRFRIVFRVILMALGLRLACDGAAGLLFA